MNRRGQNPYESFAQKSTGKLKTPNASTDLFTQKKKRPIFLRGFAFLFAALLLLSVLYNAIVNTRVNVKSITVSIPKLPSAFEGYTLLHISDLYGAQFGNAQEKIRDTLAGRSFSVACITGDMASPSGDVQPFFDLLDALDTKKPVFFIAGEQDPPCVMNDASQGDSVLSFYVTGAQQRGATFLDAPVCLESGGQRLWFAPESALTLDVEATERTLSDRLAQEKQKNESGADAYIRRQALEYQLERTQRIRTAREQMQEDDVCIVLTHVPLDSAFIASTAGTTVTGSPIARMDLVLAGHYNGGQSCLPLLGPIYLPGRGFFPGTQGVSGLLSVGELIEHISPGLGVNPAQLIPLRLFNPPTITLIKLTAQI